jgi:predicted nucleotidyltransferase
MAQAVSYLNLVPEITRRILSVSKPQKIILFGSYARGDFGPDSDLDLLVVLDYIESPRAESNRLRRVLRGLLAPVDILVATSEQIERNRRTVGLIYRPALEEGKVIYERPAA